MLLNFLDEHGNYRESLEESAARAAAAEANSLLARDRRGRKKGRRSRNKNIDAGDGGDDEWDEEEDEAPPQITQQSNNNNNNGLPEDPYEQIQFYFQTFKSRTSTQLQEQLQTYQTSTTNWVHNELHHDQHVSTTSLVILLITTTSFLWRKRSKKYGLYQRIHSILGKKFIWKDYLHPSLFRGTICYQLAPQSIPTLTTLQLKAAKAEEVALQSMRPYQRNKYVRFRTLEIFWGERIVACVLMVGMVLSGMTFCMSLHNLLTSGSGGGEEEEGGGEEEDTTTMTTDGYIYSLDGETDSDGYPLHLRNVAEQRYAECIVDAEVGGRDPNELCDLNAFFGKDASSSSHSNSVVLRTKINTLLTHIGVPSVLSTYLTTLPSQTLAYLSSLFTLCLFVLSHYISHKIHLATISNDPMKHFVVADKTVKADGTVSAKKGETEAQRKKRERMLQAERYKAQMTQLAYEAKTKAQARMARMEGKEAAKREEEEKVKKVVEEQDETVQMYGRQFGMIKAGVPDGAILISFLPMGIEEEEAKEILTKLREIKERRSAEAKKAEEEEAQKAEEEKRADEMKDRIAAERLKKLKSGKLPRSSGPPSMGLLPSSSTANVARKGKKSTGEKTEVEKADEAKKAAAMKERIAAKTGEPEKAAPGLKVAQPWASPGKKEKRGAKNKRWDKVTKSWVDRDLETKGGDAVSTSVTLKKDEGDNEEFAPVHKAAAQSPALPTKKAIDPVALRSSMMNQIRKKSPSPDQSKMKSEEFNAFVPTHTSPRRRVSIDKNDSVGNAGTSATTTTTTTSKEVVEKKYEPKKFNPVSPRINTEKSEETKTTSSASSQSSSPPPVLLRVITESHDDVALSPQSFDNPSAWSRRSSARDIKAMIEAVEAAPEDQAENMFLGPNSLHTPAFENAMRASQASWDKRPSSRDIMAKIRATEEQEANAEEEKALRRSTKSKGRMIRIDEGKNMIKQMKSQDSTDSKIGTALLKKSRSQGGINSDDDISEISMVDELSLSITSTTYASPPSPKQLKKPSAHMTESELNKIPKLGALNKSDLSKTKDEASETGTDGTCKNSGAKSDESEPKEETEEEKLRKKKADERAKKFEAMNARRRKGKGDDDGTAVSGISRRHRIRRKRSALATITPDEKKRDEWKKGIFASVLNVEQERWKKSIYAHVINAEETSVANIKAQNDLEELNAAAKIRIENQKRIDAKAKKFAVRAEKFHKLRQGGDGGSVVSSASRMRRRRTRKAGVDTPPQKAALTTVPASPSTEAAPVDKKSVETESIVEEHLAAQNENDVSQEPDSKQQDATDDAAETEQNGKSTEESPDQREDEMKDISRDIDLEKIMDEAEHGVEEVNAALKPANIDQLSVVGEIPSPEKGGEVTPISASPDRGKPAPKSSLSAMKNMTNRRKAAAKKKKMQSN